MIDFRYFLVTIAAVFLALATGIVVGAVPLGQAERPTSGAGPDAAELRERLARTQQRAAYAEQVATSVGSETLAGQLDDRRVVLVSLPGADMGTVRALAEALRHAGGRVTQTVQFTQKWADPQQRQFLEDLSARLVTTDVTMPQGGVYDRAATLFARAVLGPAVEPQSAPTGPSEPARRTPQAGASGDDAGAAGQRPGQARSADPSVRILGAYAEGGLARSEGDPGPADLALVVAPSAPDGEHSEVPWRSLVRVLDRVGDGTVVAGPPDAARRGGTLAAIRSDAATSAAVSTVDVANRASGRLAVVLALAEQLDGEAGHYGMVGSIDGALPG